MTTATPPRDPETRGVRLVAVLLALMLVSGLIDAVSYLGLGHVFTANMTGNVVILGFAAAGTPGFSVPHSATSLAAFMLGAAAGGRVAARFGTGSRRRWMRVTLAVEAALVAGAAVVAFAGSGTPATRYALIALTAFAMGLRNANVRKLGVPDLTATTVLTTTLTGLLSESRLGDGTSHRSPRRAAAVVALFAGAVLGAWLIRDHSPGVPLLVAAAVSGVLALIASGRE
ncbi:YoaK family protein [Streptomyces sp. NPDC058457]|uniref:YoaK family protein n=1 Tax=Streptomyces sp. NPDC058457 TaxID=3346507 RepID=UPI0036635A14